MPQHTVGPCAVQNLTAILFALVLKLFTYSAKKSISGSLNLFSAVDFATDVELLSEELHCHLNYHCVAISRIKKKKGSR